MLEIGVARSDITPPVGIPLVGFAGRGVSIGVHDRLYATALVATSGGETIAAVDCDLLGVNETFVRSVRQEIAERTGVSGEHVMVSCTHTHYGPDTYRDEENAMVTAYRDNLVHVLAGTVGEALGLRRPARIGVGWGESYIGINRREKGTDGVVRLGHNPKGEIDRAVGVLRVDSDLGEPVATIVNFATHPVSQGSGMRMISADYPGRARRVVEELTGAPCLFFQGACGNVNSIRMENDYEPARSLGTRLGCEVVRVWETVSPGEAEGVGSSTQVVGLPTYRYGSLEEAERLSAKLSEQLETLKREGGSDGAIYWNALRLERVNEAVQHWKASTAPEPVEAEFQAFHIGPLSWATAPGEIFNQLGGAVKRESPFEETFFVSCTNGSIGYVPVPEAYQEGGYEVTHACRVDPHASDILVETCGSLLRDLKR